MLRKFVDRKAENDSWHGQYALEFCPLADKYASEDHSSIRIIRELSRAVLRINGEGSGKVEVVRWPRLSFVTIVSDHVPIICFPLLS